MLAPWIWSLVTLFFIIGIKLYSPAKNTLPSLLMAWSTSILIISFILYLDSLFNSTHFSWEPMLLSLGLFIFCIPLYCKYLQLTSDQEKRSKQGKKSRAS